MFLFANLQYLFVVVAFSTGKPFRRPFYTNIYFLILLVALIVFDYCLMLFYLNKSDPFYTYLGVIIPIYI